MATDVHHTAVQDVGAIAHIHVDTWRTTYRGIMTEEFLSNISYEGRRRMWEDALDNPEFLIGIATGRISESEVESWIARHLTHLKENE